MKPHLIFFNPDQFRADALGHLGNSARPTPFLDKLVEEEAVSFSHAFCQNPVCTPSRCSFMSGWYPHVRGHRTMYHMMQPDEPVLLRTLKQAGYHVWWGGKNDLIPGQGSFEPYCSEHNSVSDSARPYFGDIEAKRGDRGDPSYYSFYGGSLPETGQTDPGGRPMYRDPDWDHVLAACRLIREWDGEAPLCIYLPLLYPHPPYIVEQHWIDSIDPSRVPTRIQEYARWDDKPAILRGIRERQNLASFDEEWWNELRRVYLAMCARIDYQASLVAAACRERGIWDDTAFFFFSDHGDFTGDYGLVEKTQNTFQDCLTRVPFILKPPRNAPVTPGIRDGLIELIDFPATVEELTGIQPAHTHFGRSLMPAVGNAGDSIRPAVFCEGGRLAGETHCMELESRGSHDNSALYWPRVGLQKREDGNHGKAIMVRTKEMKYVRRLNEADELYDLQKDPQELHNLINDADYTGIIAELKETLLNHIIATADAAPHRTDNR